jgi:hypothetical protein
MKNTVFWNVTLLILSWLFKDAVGTDDCVASNDRVMKSYRQVEIYSSFGGTYCLHFQGENFRHFKMEIVLYSETLVNFYHSVRKQIPEERRFKYRCLRIHQRYDARKAKATGFKQGDRVDVINNAFLLHTYSHKDFVILSNTDL